MLNRIMANVLNYKKIPKSMINGLRMFSDEQNKHYTFFRDLIKFLLLYSNILYAK